MHAEGSKLMNLFSRLFKKGKTVKAGPEGGVFLKKEWEYIADDIITTNAVVSSDGSIIVFGTKQGKVYGISNDGRLKWKYEHKSRLAKEKMFFVEEGHFRQITAEPVIADINNDGEDEIIISSELGVITVLSISGKPLWNFSAKDSIKAAAVVADINNDNCKEILFGSSDSFIYALGCNGKLLWKFKCGSPLESIPAVAHGSEIQVLCGSNEGLVYSLDSRGNLLWTFPASGKITAQPAIINMGGNRQFTIVGSLDKCLYAIDLRGNLIWKYDTEGEIYSKAVIADINNDRKPEILFSSCDDSMHVISSLGNKIWEFETDFWVVASPLVFDINNDNKEEIIIGSYDNYIYALDSECDFVLDYMPGISSITQQTGNYFDIIAKEPGKYFGKLLWKHKADSAVQGIVPVLKPSRGILVTTNTRKLDKFIYYANNKAV